VAESYRFPAARRRGILAEFALVPQLRRVPTEQRDAFVQAGEKAINLWIEQQQQWAHARRANAKITPALRKVTGALKATRRATEAALAVYAELAQALPPVRRAALKELPRSPQYCALVQLHEILTAGRIPPFEPWPNAPGHKDGRPTEFGKLWLYSQLTALFRATFGKKSGYRQVIAAMVAVYDETRARSMPPVKSHSTGDIWRKVERRLRAVK
jgi:hypothetical protein